MKQLYTLAILNNRGEPRSHSLWLDKADISTEEGMESIKRALVVNYFSLGEEDDPSELDVFESAHVSEAPPIPANVDVSIEKLCRHEVMEGEEPLPAEPGYQVRTQVRENGGVTVDAFLLDENGKPSETIALSVWMEISGGLPTAHIYCGATDDCAMTLYGLPNGNLLPREGDGSDYVDRMQPKSFMPAVESVIEEFALLKQTQTPTERG